MGWSKIFSVHLMFAICILLTGGCQDKVASKTEGISDAQQKLYDEFSRIQDRIHSAGQLKEHFAKGFKPSSATLKKLRKFNVQIYEPASDIKITGSDAKITVTFVEIGKDPQEDGSMTTQEWSMTKEGDKWKLKDIQV